MNSLSKIIALSGTLAFGFLLVVLATALYNHWTPILIAMVFGVAHLPLLISTSGSSNTLNNGFDFDDKEPSQAARFLSSFLLTSGIVCPIALTHSHVLAPMAAVLTIAGGLAIWGTIVVFTSFFDSVNEDPF